MPQEEHVKLPFDQQNEEAVIGAIIIKPQCIDEVVEDLLPEMFYINKYKLVYTSMRNLHTEGKLNDIVSLKTQLKKDKVFEQIGGDLFFIDAMSFDSAPSSIRFYAENVIGLHIRRELIKATLEIKEMAYTDYSTGADKVAEKAEQTILKVGDVSLRETKSFDQQTDEYIETYKDWQQNKDRLLKTGWEIDKLLRGFRPGNFVVIGARPSIGKTMFAIDMARNFAKIGKRGVFFSLEMQHGEILERGISSSKRVRYADIRDFRVNADEMQKHAHDMKDKLRIDVIDYPRQTINQIRQLARRIKKRNERYNSSLDFIIVDYLQLISSHNPKKSAFDIVSEVSEEMKNLAKELGVAVIALSQLSRSSSKENRMPTMSDLRQSGQIEQDADVVMLLHRDYDQETGEKSNNLVVKIEKNRAGQTGIINMYADVAYQTVFDYE